MSLKINSLSYLGRAVKLCAQPLHLRRTLTIALIVGSWLTLFNQGDLLLSGRVSYMLVLKVFLNYLTPFVVANLGLLSSSARKPESSRPARSESPRSGKRGREHR